MNLSSFIYCFSKILTTSTVHTKYRIRIMCAAKILNYLKLTKKQETSPKTLGNIANKSKQAGA